MIPYGGSTHHTKRQPWSPTIGSTRSPKPAQTPSWHGATFPRCLHAADIPQGISLAHKDASRSVYAPSCEACREQDLVLEIAEHRSRHCESTRAVWSTIVALRLDTAFGEKVATEPTPRLLPPPSRLSASRPLQSTAPNLASLHMMLRWATTHRTSNGRPCRHSRDGGICYAAREHGRSPRAAHPRASGPHATQGLSNGFSRHFGRRCRTFHDIHAVLRRARHTPL